MKHYTVTLKTGEIMQTIMPIKSINVKLECIFLFSEDKCKGYGLGVIPLSNVLNVMLEEDD